jgi:phosphoenolpyruvate-protein phosphotransferase (PTS system enzyme I)
MRDGARSEGSPEVLAGIGVSAGIAIGRAVVIEGSTLGVFRMERSPEEVAGEVVRFQRAVRAAWRQLRMLRDRIRQEAGEPYARVFQAQILILKDRALLQETAKVIRRERVNAEWALRTVVRRYTQVFSQLDDGELKDRGSDIEDVEARIQAALSGSRSRHDLAGLKEDAIVVAATLSPSDVVSMNRGHVIGLGLDGGGRTSHTAILAGTLGLPAVVGLRDASTRVRSGDRLMLDGAAGTLTLHPTEGDLEQARARRDRLARRELDLMAMGDQPATTLDGVTVAIRANVELPEEMLAARRFGAEGVGLYRSEYLYLRAAPALPDEETHYRAYRELAEQALPHEVVIRTLDLGGDAPSGRLVERKESNPVLGLRAIRLCLRRPELFRTQLRGILRAAAHGKIRILLPMVSGLAELRQAKAVLQSVGAELLKERVPFEPEVPLGVMIEVPAAALIADRLLQEVDFLSIGTNDLIQYTLAIDRGNEAVSYLYQPLHPAILVLLRCVATAAQRVGARLAVCGEMAADPVGAVALLGLGMTEFSMNPAAIPAIKQVVRSVSLRAARAIVDDALTQGTAAEVEDLVRRRVLDLLPTEFACPL